MSAHAHAHGGSEASHGADHGPGFYVKIWALLLFLLVVSIVGPMFGHVWVTLVTAFGIALVKAGMVAAYFMHLNVEKKYVWYLLYTMLLLMLLLFMGVAPDVMMHGGGNWVNQASHNLSEQYKEWRRAPLNRRRPWLGIYLTPYWRNGGATLDESKQPTKRVENLLELKATESFSRGLSNTRQKPSLVPRKTKVSIQSLQGLIKVSD